MQRSRFLVSDQRITGNQNTKLTNQQGYFQDDQRVRLSKKLHVQAQLFVKRNQITTLLQMDNG